MWLCLLCNKFSNVEKCPKCNNSASSILVEDFWLPKKYLGEIKNYYDKMLMCKFRVVSKKSGAKCSKRDIRLASAKHCKACKYWKHR